MNYAGAGTRFVAALIDGIILWVVNFLIGIVLGSIAGDQNTVASGVMGGLSLESYVISLAIGIGYWVFYQSSTGQTLGKKVMKIKVVDVSGNKPTAMTFFLREIIGKLVSSIILLIGYLMILWDGKKQGLHDKIASTYVIHV